MSSSTESPAKIRRSTRERKKAEPFVSAATSSSAKRKRSGANEKKNGSGPRKVSRKSGQAAPIPGPPTIKNVEKIELSPLASGGLPDPFDGFRSLRDEAENRLIYYGSAPDNSRHPAIFAVDCNTFESTNITGNLEYDDKSTRRSFPALTDPWAVLVKPEPDKTFLLIFGGITQGQGRGNGALYYVNLTQKRWGEVTTDPKLPWPKPRVAAAACAIGTRVFAFGGSVKGQKAMSYCVGDVSLDKNSHKISVAWTTVDKPYPANIPSSGSFGGVALLDGGKNILLLPGGRNRNFQVIFSGDKDKEMTLYNTETDEFTRIPSGGMRTLPTAHWYHSMPPPVSLLPKLPHFEMEGVLHPTSFLLAHTEDVTLGGADGRSNSHHSHLWAVSVHTESGTIKVKRIDVEEELQRIWDESKVEFFGFFTTAQKMCFWGMKGDAPVAGSAYVAEVKIKM